MNRYITFFADKDIAGTTYTYTLGTEWIFEIWSIVDRVGLSIFSQNQKFYWVCFDEPKPPCLKWQSLKEDFHFQDGIHHPQALLWYAFSLSGHFILHNIIK